MVSLRYLAVHPQERGPGAAEDGICSRVCGGSGWAKNEQELGECYRPPRHMRTVSSSSSGVTPWEYQREILKRSVGGKVSICGLRGLCGIRGYF